MSSVDVEYIASLMVQAADRYIVPRYKTLQDHEISTKSGPTDMVTQADIEAEAFLEGVLEEVFPDAVVLGEESVSRGDKSLDALQQDTGMIWLLDPVDGTSNFVKGNDRFGVMAACIIDGVTRYSWIYDVPQRLMYIAELGHGAYVYSVDEGVEEKSRLQVSDTAPEEMVAHINYKFFPDSIRPHVIERAERVKQATPLGSAAHEYTQIALGHSHCAVYSRLKPWDHLAGALLVQESGGFIAKWDSAAYTPKDDYAGLIVTTSRARWDALYSVFFDGLDIERYL